MRVMIKKRFGLDIPVFVIAKKNLSTSCIVHRTGGGTEISEIYDNLISFRRPHSAEVYIEIGEPRAELEKK